MHVRTLVFMNFKRDSNVCLGYIYHYVTKGSDMCRLWGGLYFSSSDLIYSKQSCCTDTKGQMVRFFRRNKCVLLNNGYSYNSCSIECKAFSAFIFHLHTAATYSPLKLSLWWQWQWWSFKNGIAETSDRWRRGGNYISQFCWLLLHLNATGLTSVNEYGIIMKVR